MDEALAIAGLVLGAPLGCLIAYFLCEAVIALHKERLRKPIREMEKEAIKRGATGFFYIDGH